jgi:HSP20 family protein
LWGDPWRELYQLQRDMNRLFDGTGFRGRPEFPAVNVYTSGGGALVTAELPGMDPKDIDISVEGNTLTIRGTRKEDYVKEGTVVHRRERGTGGFARSVQLPFRADPESVEAKYERGVLRVSLETIPQEKPRKIAVKTA